MVLLRQGEFKKETYERLTAITKTRLLVIKAAVEKMNEQTDVITLAQQKILKLYSNEINRKKAEFDLNLERAISCTGEDSLSAEILSNDQSEIEDLFIQISACIETLHPLPEVGTSNSHIIPDTISTPNTCSQVRLPQLELNKFNGDLSTWTTFINLFDTTIHHNESLSNVIKFQYLLSVLSDEPFNLIRNLNLSNENYQIAYGLLKDRYQNDRRLQLLHLNNIIDLPQISLANVSEIRKFVNIYNENTQALQAIQCDIQNPNPLLTAIILRKMDVELRKRLEDSRSSTQHTLPTTNEIFDFLNTECVRHEDAMCSLNTRSNDIHISSKCHQAIPHTKYHLNKNVSMTATQHASGMSANIKTCYSCAACNQTTHKIYACPFLLSKTPQERYQLIKTIQRCVSCLGAHDIKSCKSQSTCKVCNKRHNTLLHFPSNKSDSFAKLGVPKLDASQHISTSHIKDRPTSSKLDTSVTLMSHNHTLNEKPNITVLLGTVLVRLRSPNGSTHVFRALLDSGSMCNLITERVAQVLNVRRQRCDIQISGINQSVTHNKGQTFITMETLSGLPVVTQQPMIILDKLTVDLPRMPVTTDVVKHTQCYNLADPTFHVPGRIDVVLGASIFPTLFTGEQISLGHNMPHAVGTRFGYVIMGTATCMQNNTLSHSTHTSILNVCLHATNETDTDLHTSIQRFWHQEEPPMCSIQTQDDVICEQHFTATHTRDKTGRYIVRLPFKSSDVALGTSRDAAELRLHAMERKFNNNRRFSQLYHEFMDDYLTLGHMSKCNTTPETSAHYFLPHHGVLKESSSTTKLRTVFDASCKTSSGISLNDILLTGRKLQTNIADVLIHFRRHNIVFCCDIRQMYRQISIHPDDRNFQLICWRHSTDQPMTVFQLNTVTYGLNCSPYLAIRTLHQLADDDGQDYPDAAHAIRNHTYVDDIITGASTVEKAIDLKNQLISLLKLGGFELRKWVSNSPQLLHSISEAHLESPTFLNDSQNQHFTVLGLQWSPTTDNFSYKVQLPDNTTLHTKRTVLSTIAKIYDPCGFLTPFIMLAKCFMQNIWARGLSWDSQLPDDLRSKWHSFIDDTKYLPEISIARALNIDLVHKLDLHGFCDASENGYAAVVYFRCEHFDGSVTVNLVLSKSRVAPLKRVTIPRLELCAAHLLAQLVSHCKSLFPDHIRFDNIHLWSDSMIALTWLRTPSYRLKTYVANRVSQTQELVPPEVWKHIPSEHNPADCASRGLSLSILKNHSSWWNGPSWLTSSLLDWPSVKFIPISLENSSELKLNPLPVLNVNQHEDWSFLMRFSSWIMLQRVMAFVLRFTHNCQTTSYRQGNLTSDELHEAKLKIFFAIQQSSFSQEFLMLTQHNCPKQLKSLNPFIDKYKLIRVGGRLRQTDLPYETKHPVLLPKRHHVINILIDYYHIHYLHAGPQLVQSLLSQEVWILCARSVIKSRIHKCIACFKHRPVNTTPLMGDLPAVRINPAKPFSSTGIDYGGPYNIKITNLRFIKHIKVYICVFICMITKATHIEVVTDLTTEAFIAALSRFISRRGKCSDIYSDCGTNFVGANAVLRKILQSSIHDNKSRLCIQRFTANSSIRFHFNPPAAPHHGGLWESAIKSAKHHLHRVMGTTILTLPEFITLTVRIEAMLNSRPLTPLSNDPSDLSALTPGHFLTGGPIVSLPETDFTNVPENRLKHWYLVQQFQQRIWKRWSLEYLHTLQQRTKWNTSPSYSVKIGDLVLLHTLSSSYTWPLARVVDIFPGTDGIVRVAKVKTQDGIFTRPVTKLFPLPLE